MCVLSIKVPIRKKSRNLLNDPRNWLFLFQDFSVPSNLSFEPDVYLNLLKVSHFHDPFLPEMIREYSTLLFLFLVFVFVFINKKTVMDFFINLPFLSELLFQDSSHSQNTERNVKVFFIYSSEFQYLFLRWQPLYGVFKFSMVYQIQNMFIYFAKLGQHFCFPKINNPRAFAELN